MDYFGEGENCARVLNHRTRRWLAVETWSPCWWRIPRTCRDHRPDVSAALTTVAFDQSGPRWLGISDLIAEPEGPTFISYKGARSRLDRLRFVRQNPSLNSSGTTSFPRIGTYQYGRNLIA